MTEGPVPPRAGEIIFHFDVKRSSIPLSNFIDTARATQSIIDDFNTTYFDGKLKYELHVRTPEDGSLIEVLAVVLTSSAASATAVFWFLSTDIGKAFFKGLTTQTPAEWAEQFGTTLRERTPRIFAAADPETLRLQPPALDVPDIATITFQTDGLVEPDVGMFEDDAIETSEPSDTDKEVAAEAVALITVSFLRLDEPSLRQIGITPEKSRGAFSGRNKFFEACIANPEVDGISFQRDPVFEIRRSDFPGKIVRLPDVSLKELDELAEAADQKVETVDIVVNSPNWKRGGRRWQAATKKHQDISFEIEDDGFWLLVERKEIQPDIRDNLRVQWAYTGRASKPTNVRVLRVISYNGKPISAPLSDAEVKAQLANARQLEPDDPDLFDERRLEPRKDKKD
ncbi:MAG TPA: hypothetical protein DCL54_09170 [Alphaproteobacteria bacterium]|nr:hypothetical protein [Alphaproteobacteria bacterium]